MNEKTKIIEIGAQRFRIGKLDPQVGSFILMKMIGAASKQTDGPQAPPQAQSHHKEEKPPTGEEMVRAIAYKAFVDGLDIEMFSLVQKKCLARVDVMAGEAPLPVVDSFGRWTAREVDQDDYQMLLKLTMEVLVFNHAGFFDQGGFSNLIASENSTR